MFVVDTNVLLYAANSAAHEHEPCRELLEGWRRSATAWFATWGILYEFARVATHHRVFASPLTLERAWAFVEAILQSPGFSVLVETERHAEVASEVFGEVAQVTGNLLHDAHVAVLMREHGIRRIVTRDTDFHRFAFLTVEDPLAEGRGNSR